MDGASLPVADGGSAEFLGFVAVASSFSIFARRRWMIASWLAMVFFCSAMTRSRSSTEFCSWQTRSIQSLIVIRLKHRVSRAQVISLTHRVRFVVTLSGKLSTVEEWEGGESWSNA